DKLEAIIRALGTRDSLRALLIQVLDTMVLWTGVERGLMLLRAPDGRLVPRAARNLARRDLHEDQMALSQTIARRALETGEAVVAARDAELDATRMELERTRDATATRFVYDRIIGRSEPMQALLRLVDRVTASEVPVLFVGESGTGKELVARAVHHNGARAR